MDTIRVLIVDDDAAGADSVRRQLMLSKQYNMEVLTADTHTKAMSLVQSFAPHVVVLDNYLTGEDPNELGEGAGWSETLPALAANVVDQRPLVICFTGHRKDMEEVSQTSGWGAFAFIDKQEPQATSKLARKVEEAFQKWLTYIEGDQ